MKKILISAPTAASKNYCVEAWLKNIQTLTYPWFEVILYDNTTDGGLNANYLNSLAEELCTSFSFLAIHVPFSQKKYPNAGLMERLATSHNFCRQALLDGNFSHLLHLETDVFPEAAVIERLLEHNKPVIGAPYYRDEGKSRKLMAQRHVYRGPNNILAMNLTPDEDILFMDGSIKKVAHAGLGCLLIKRQVLEHIVFRCRAGIDAAPDTYFAEDCFRLGIPIFMDTSLVCEHRNQAWGNYGVDYF